MSVILTQIRLPERRRDLLRRPRLIDALHRHLHRKLTYVSAPAGYGKTALLVDFASDVDAVVCWYNIGRDHGDPAVFTEHLIAAFRQRFPAFGQSLLEAVRAQGRLPDPRALATELVNEMVRRVDDFCVLMLDDFHLVGEVPAIGDLIDALLDHLPDQVRVVIASRSVYGIPATRLYVREQLATLNRTDLCFRADEVQALWRQVHRLPLGDAEAAGLARHADGWIVAILLAARASAPGHLPRQVGAVDQIYAFLAEEVLHQQPEPLRRLLFATAVVDEFDDALATHLLGSPATDRLLDLERRNLFVTRTESEDGASYRYHQLFADFLRGQLRAADPGEAQRLHRRAAEWFAAREEWTLAVHHRLLAGERDGAARWMDRAAPSLFVSGHAYTLEQWARALEGPPDLREHAPRLALGRAKMLVDQGEHRPAEELLDIAERALRREGDEDQVANALITRGMLRRFQGDFASALALAQSARSLLSEPQSYRGFQALRLEGICLGGQGHSEAAVECIASAVTGFRRLGQMHDLAEALNDLGILHYERGEMPEAQRCFQEVLHIRRRLGHPGALALALNNAGYLFCQAGRYKDAWRAYEEALPAAQAVRLSRIAALLLNSQGDLLRDLEEWDAAQAAYDSALEISQATDNRTSAAASCAGRAELERLRGNFNEALHWLREAARHSGEDINAPAHRSSLGGVYLDMGQRALAEQTFRDSLAAWEGSRPPRQAQALAAFLLARALFEQGRADEALAPLGLALEWAARLGYDQFLVVAGRRARPLLAHAVRALPNQPQLRSLLERVDGFRAGRAWLLAEPAAPSSPDSLRLELLAFGPGRVRRNAEPLPNSAWASVRARALLFYLADRRGAPKEEIGLEFWPDFTAAKTSSNFHVTLWRIRRAIGRDAIIFEDDLYRLSPTVSVWHDVAEFEACLGSGASTELLPEERAEAWRRAIALYQGDYLTEVALEWAERRRSDLQAKLAQALAGLADWETARRHYPEAQALYERLIGLDPYGDEAHAGLMRCLARSGALAQAKAHYLAYAKLLRRDLDTTPGQALCALYERIRCAG